MLTSGIYIDSDHPSVQAFARAVVRNETNKIEQAKLLYIAVRDGFRYNPYKLHLTHEALKASHLLTRKEGYCIEKACLLAAAARVLDIPSRLGFADVKNHIGTEKLEHVLGTNVLYFHGYTELFLNGHWVKSTPAFNKELCDKLGVAPLEFNGIEDSIFQEYSASGTQFMEYLYDYGRFDDVPFDLFVNTFITHYGHLTQIKIPGFELIIEK